ncbi:hypothetical protein FACS1894218_1320 [Bacilli bacterium]|nr:hypothetical protein FACS1894218_1320 [Bacilli bacterium]
MGRIKNLIILDNGENVSPEALEGELKNYPLVRDSLVYAGKNEVGNQVIIAEIFPCPDYAKAAKVADIPNAIQSIVDEINHRLPTYMGMHKVIIRETDFERGPSKKIIRKQ